MPRYKRTRRGWRDTQTAQEYFKSYAYRDESLSSGWRHITGRPASKREISTTKAWEKRYGGRASQPERVGRRAARKKPAKKKPIQKAKPKRKPPQKAKPKKKPPRRRSPRKRERYQWPDPIEWVYYYDVEDALMGPRNDGPFPSIMDRFRKIWGRTFTWRYTLTVTNTRRGRRRESAYEYTYSFTLDASAIPRHIIVDRRRRPDIEDEEIEDIPAPGETSSGIRHGVQERVNGMTILTNEFLNDLYGVMTEFILYLKSDEPLLYDDLRQQFGIWEMTDLSVEAN